MARPMARAAREKIARQYIAAYERYEAARETKIMLQQMLLPVIQNCGPIKVDGKEVVRTVSSSKSPTKKQLIARFGKDVAERFWDTVDERLSIYLTVKPNRRFTAKT